MPNKEINIIVRAKNAVAAGLSAAGKSLKSFASGVANVAKKIATGFLAAGTAAVALGTKMVQAFSVQEAAENAAASALASYGDNVAYNMKQIKAFTAAIQDETGIGDENLIQRAAQLRLLGVSADALEDATKATIALGRAGMDETAAIKAVAMARNGEYTMLNRYLPALRSATTEAEKAQILNDFIAKGYQQQKDSLKTVAGQWAALKGRIGDFLEVGGGAIANSSGLAIVLEKVGNAVKSAGDRLKAWVDAGGVDQLIQGVRLFASNAQRTFLDFAAYAGYGIENAWERTKWFGESVATLFSNMKSVVTTVWSNMTDSFGYSLAKLQAEMSGQEWNINPPEMKDSLANLRKMPEFIGDAADKLEAKLAKNAAAQLEREGKIAADAIKAYDMRIAKAEELALAEKEGALDAAARSKEEAATRARIELADLNIKSIDAEEKANKKVQTAIEKQIALLEEKKGKLDAIAAKSVADILAENKARDDVGKQMKKDFHKAAELRGRAARGVRLSKKDIEWLDAFEEIQKARQGAAAAKNALKNAQDQLVAAQKAEKHLSDIKTEIGKQRDDLKQLLVRG